MEESANYLQKSHSWFNFENAVIKTNGS